MAFGIPNSTDLTALADKLGAIVASVGPEEQAVLTAAIGQLSDHGSALISQAGAAIQTDLAPLVNESGAWRMIAGQLLTTGISGTIGGIPFTIKAAQA